ncbi:hypothetical protein [Micromonospora narathiwatensis]|uniref:Uncharacterized protein n=1 Tax=Micromonospora narathiwatensis TaxID=299146 RepID=A0A1A8Z9G2_9ACTN|nr:hypothetical protein [Micromonospora narathiwatensis]SBT40505.1 hypothetical protein GA0070621_0980 [Micromonospora narathiwatensis]
MMDPTGQVLRRFPLVARPRPIAKALNIRVDELRALADRTERENNLAAASAVYNQAALIASDCGQPNLARQWCHEHADAYLHALPLGAQAARHALEPLVNLARLHIRDGNGDAAHQLLTDLFQAVSSRADTLIDGRSLPGSKLTRTEDDHREVRQWLWSVLIADGARALTSAGRWKEAYDHLQQNNGIGQRMLDGRQVAVITHVASGDIKRARTIIAETARGEPWEEAVTACLAYLCARAAGEPEEAYLDALLGSYRRLTPTPSLAVFHTRLGLAVIDAAGGIGHPDVRSLAAGLIKQACTLDNAYVARDLLHHRDVLTVIDAQAEAELAETLQASGTTHQGMPIVVHERLLHAVTISRAVLQGAGTATAARRP